METTEIMENEEVMDLVPTEEVAEVASRNSGLKTVATVGISALVGVLAYKYLIVPTIAKLKAHKQKKAMQCVPAETDYYEDSEENEVEEDSK